MKTVATLIAALALTACASPDYAQYSKAQTDIATARSAADAARYRALSDIAATGDSSAKVAAVMALTLGGQGSGAQTTMQAPQASQALQWASILVPGLTQVAGMRYQHLSAVVQSNNSAAVAQSTNAAFVGIAGKIQAPGSVTTNTLSGTGTMGGGAYATTDRNDTIATDRHDVTTPAPVVVVPVIIGAPAPEVAP